MESDAALALLDDPRTACEGARALAARGERGALLPLLRAYQRSGEGEGVCLLEAMGELDPVAGARELSGGDAEARRLAAWLLELFPSDADLDLLERALADADDAVRGQALRSLRLQWRTDAWEALLRRLVDSSDPEVRSAAADLLAERDAG